MLLDLSKKQPVLIISDGIYLINDSFVALFHRERGIAIEKYHFKNTNKYLWLQSNVSIYNEL